MGVLFPWADRMKVRRGIDQMFMLREGLQHHLEGKRRLSDGALEAIRALSGTDDPEGMMRAMQAVSEGAKHDYMERTRRQAYDDLTAFAEVMNYDQPAAAHHVFICEHLMEAEQGHLERFSLSAPPGHAKPLWTGTQIIAKPKGSHGRGKNDKRMTLGEVEVGCMVWTHKKRWKRVTAVHEQGVLPTLHIVDAAGAVHRPNDDHPFLTARGWVNATDLRVGDLLLRTLPSEGLDARLDPIYMAEYDESYHHIQVLHIRRAAPANCRCLTVEEDASFTLAGKAGTRHFPSMGGVIVHNSTYASHLFGAWYLGRNPEKIFLQAGNTQGFVESQISQKVRAYIEDENYKTVFEEIAVSRRKSALKQWKLSNEKGEYNARGVGTAIAGFRAHFGNVDDPLGSREDAESPTKRNKLWAWFQDDFNTRLLPRAPLGIVATRWHEDDLIGKLMQQEDGNPNSRWEFINLPALAEDDDPMGREIGEPLWPDFYTKEILLEFKRVQTGRGWNSLYQGSPIDAEGGVFNIEWMHRYEALPPENTVKLISVSVDCANKDNERNDYTAISVWYETHSGKHYLVNMVRRRMQFTDMKNTVNLIARRYGADQIIVEDKGAGTQYIQTQSGQDGRRRKAPAPVVAVNPGNNSKEFRFDGVVPLIKVGEVLFPIHSDWIADLERELAGFPDGSYDDQVDTISQYLATAANVTKRGSRKASRTKQKKGQIEEMPTRPPINYIGSPMQGHNGGPPL